MDDVVNRRRRNTVSLCPWIVAGIRKEKGWTQDELARVSGYSLRVISKAEAGKPVDADTARDIADSLSCDVFRYEVEKLVFDPVSVARTFVTGYYIHQGELIDKVRPILDENLTVSFSGDPQQIPFAGTHVGLEAAANAFRVFFSILHVPDVSEGESAFSYTCTPRNLEEVLVWGSSTIHPIGRPMNEPIEIQLRIRFRDCLIHSVEDRFDTLKGARVIQGDC